MEIPRRLSPTPRCLDDRDGVHQIARTRVRDRHDLSLSVTAKKIRVERVRRNADVRRRNALTRERDVHNALETGAAACGFVLSASPRQVAPTRAGELAAVAAVAGDVLTVAVVTTESSEWVAAALVESGLRAVQLSAGADGPSVAAVQAAAGRRGLRPLVIAAADMPDAGSADFTLLDARRPGVYGGTGAALDWRALAQSALPPKERLVVAGGLTPRNVGEAVAALRPSMVDVCSGTEAAPGVKDEGLLAEFFAAVADADCARGVPA